jgi:phosphate starvation-inducible PhoH-like protein
VAKRNRESGKRKHQPQEVRDDTLPIAPQKASKEPIAPKTEAQKRYINAIKAFPLVFGVGSAGTGKTWLAGALAAQLLENGTVERIIITRPAVEAGESLGFLPGELDQKYEPFIAPFREVLNERLGASHVDVLIKAARIEAAPLAYMRGRTFRDAFVILDEAQNTTPRQMKLFLSRIGANCKCVVDGDPNQTDLLGPSGLDDAIKRLKHIPAVKIVTFCREDIVRSGLVGEIVQAYEEPIPSLGIAAV